MNFNATFGIILPIMASIRAPADLFVERETSRLQENYRLATGLSYLVATVSTIAFLILTIYSTTYLPPLVAFIFAGGAALVICGGFIKTFSIYLSRPDEMKPKKPLWCKVHIVVAAFFASTLFITIIGSVPFTSPGISAGLLASRIGVLAGFGTLNLAYGILGLAIHKLKGQRNARR